MSPEAPPYGGMALQAGLLRDLLTRDGNSVVFVASNCSFGESLRFLEHVPCVRTVSRFLVVCIKLCKNVSQVDVVHVLAASWFYFFAVVVPAVLIAKAGHKRVVLNYRGGDAERFFARFRRVIQPVFRMADTVTAPSEFLGRLIERYFAVPVSVVGNILDRSAFPYRERIAFGPRIVVARHLEEIYGVESVLKAFRLIQDSYPSASLAVAGTGSQESSLRAMAAELNLRNMRFLGHVAHRDLPAIYDEHDVFLNGSRVDNFPGALLEASATGLVVVSTGAGGIPFMYRHGENALLVPPGDWQALARAVITVLESPCLARKLATAGIALAESCEWAKVSESVYGAYGFKRNSQTGALAAAPQSS